ncbi:MAG: serine/threonine protein kinase [Tannerella sp.]|jgi:serine/threonine-protein kinase|nr:serine/threonine protein kinase [Tannerella sp.]
MNLSEGHNLQNAKYQLTKVIGQGGFGITYLGVWHTEVKGNLGTVKTDVPVCIKEYFFKDYCYRDENSSNVLVHSETGKLLFHKFKEKLIKEAKILSDVHHPHIVNVLEVFEENNTAYIAMEHIAGCSLKYMLDVEGVLPEKQVLRYIAQIAQALDFVHRKSILHLDIKPSNILIDRKNNARLIDFGVSKRYDIEQQETSTTMLTVSKGFAPIEQYDNEGTLNFSPCPDIYSLGATMYNLLTGEIPTESILRVAKPLIKPSEINKDISKKTETVILMALQLNPIDRYQSVQAMINEMDIPSYFEETSNPLIEEPDYQSKNGNKEETELMTDSNNSQPVDEEQTIARQSDNLSIPIQKKKRKRRFLVALLILLLLLVGGGIFYIANTGKSHGANLIADFFTSFTGTSEPVSDTTSNQASDSNLPNGDSTSVVIANPPPIESVRPETNEPINAKTEPENTTTTPVNILNTPTQEMVDAEYNSLLVSGKAKMEQNNFAEARTDFEKAKELKTNEEILRLLLDLEDEEEKAMINIRKSAFDAKQTFGNLTIVVKKSNARWGAIDNNGNEIIDCRYLGANRCSNNDRAFETEDHLYDIYDINGRRVAEGRPDY